MANIINFTDVNPISKKQISIIKKDIHQTIKKKDFILGVNLKKFENNFSKLSKIKYTVGCASGTDALILALKSLNLKKNDEIIVPAMTYISTALSVLLNNNKLIFADVDNYTGLVSIKNIVKNITKNTKVIIPVNLYGQKFNLKKLREIVSKKISIIEDSAQSHFAYSCFNCKKKLKNICCKKERNDQYADISCYSFYPAKNLGAFGDAGLVATNSKKLYLRLLSLRNLGSINKHKHNLIGMNSRLDTIQATILNRKLKSIFKVNDKRRQLSKIYDDKLLNIKQVKITTTNPGSSRHLYAVRTKKRNLLKKYLFKHNIYSQIHYPYSLNKMKIFKGKTKKISLKNSEKWAAECLSLPLHSNLSKKEVYRVIKVIKNFFKYK